jgi:hypothetical protein
MQHWLIFLLLLMRLLSLSSFNVRVYSDDFPPSEDSKVVPIVALPDERPRRSLPGRGGGGQVAERGDDSKKLQPVGSGESENLKLQANAKSIIFPHR